MLLRLLGWRMKNDRSLELRGGIGRKGLGKLPLCIALETMGLLASGLLVVEHVVLSDQFPHSGFLAAEYVCRALFELILCRASILHLCLWPAVVEGGGYNISGVVVLSAAGHCINSLPFAGGTYILECLYISCIS